MSNGFSFESANKLSDSLNKIADMLESENVEIQKKFYALNESFKDQTYYDYKDKFSECDKSISGACETLRAFSAGLVAYAQALRDAQ